MTTYTISHTDNNTTTLYNADYHTIATYDSYQDAEYAAIDAQLQNYVIHADQNYGTHTTTISSIDLDRMLGSDHHEIDPNFGLQNRLDALQLETTYQQVDGHYDVYIVKTVIDDVTYLVVVGVNALIAQQILCDGGDLGSINWDCGGVNGANDIRYFIVAD